jgi:hypothetical protein
MIFILQNKNISYFCEIWIEMLLYEEENFGDMYGKQLPEPDGGRVSQVI